MRGGYRNGAGRPAWRTRADSLLHIDVREWSTQGLLFEGGRFGWNPWGLENVAIGHVSVLEDHILLSSTMGRAAMRIGLDRTPCFFGGSRLWFRCPAIGCGRRVAKLYLKTGSIVCRHCGNLGYSSQSLTQRDKALAQAAKIRRLLGGSPAIAFPFPDRPLGMHRRTYRRLKKTCERHEAIAMRCLSQAVKRMREQFFV